MLFGFFSWSGFFYYDYLATLPETVRITSFSWESNLYVWALSNQAWEQYSAGAYTKAVVKVVSTLNEHDQVRPARRFIKATRDETLFGISRCGFWNGDFCQEWYPTMSDYSGMVGASQEKNLLWVDALNDGFQCHGNGLLFHVTQVISRSNTKDHRIPGKPTVREH